MNEKYKIADCVFEIQTIYSYVHEMCCEYRTEENPEFIISTEEKDIEWEQKKAEENQNKQNDFPAKYFESLAVYRKIAEVLIDRNILLIHGSAIAVDGQGYLFTAKSGVGKSTHVRFWRETFGTRSQMINDDKPLLKIKESGVWIYGTPWDGKHHLSTNVSVPLKAICILRRGEENRICRLTGQKAYSYFLQQSYRSSNPKDIVKSFSLLELLTLKIPIYKLECNLEKRAALIAYEGMQEEN
nr:hypothetical protein [uncultured Anaerobutyricum sp.]